MGKAVVINNFIKNGKKARVINQLKKIQDTFRKRDYNALDVLESLRSVVPIFGFSSITRGGIKYNVPKLLSPKKRLKQVNRWFTASVSARKKVSFSQSFIAVALDTKGAKGALVKKREEVHKQALLNQKYLRFFKKKAVVGLRLKKYE